MIHETAASEIDLHARFRSTNAGIGIARRSEATQIDRTRRGFRRPERGMATRSVVIIPPRPRPVIHSRSRAECDRRRRAKRGSYRHAIARAGARGPARYCLRGP